MPSPGSPTRARPISIAEALQRPAVDLVDVATITGLSYSTVLQDARLGELQTLRHRRRYTVVNQALRVYLEKLGCLPLVVFTSDTTRTSGA